MKMEKDSVVPSYFLCPISLEPMKDPVIVSSGITYDRKSIEKWIEDGHFTCPITRQEIRREDIIPNHALARLIYSHSSSDQQQNLQISQVKSILKTYFEDSVPQDCQHQISTFIQGLKKLKLLANKSQYNRSMISKAGALPFIAAVLSFRSSETTCPSSGLLKVYEEAIQLLVLFDLEHDMLRYRHGLSILWLIYVGNMESKVAAATIVHRLQLADINPPPILLHSALASLVNLLAEDTASNDILKAILTISSAPANRRKAVKTGLMGILIEMLSKGSSSNAEIILEVIDSLCNCAEGREALKLDTSAIPMIVANIPAQYEIRTKHAINTLISICKHVTGMQVQQTMIHLGIVERLLCVVQMHSSIKLKQQALLLLKLCSHSVTWS